MNHNALYQRKHNDSHIGGREHFGVSKELSEELSKNQKLKLEETPESEKDEALIKNLGGFLYDIKAIENDKDTENIYTIIKNKGKDRLIKIGSGNFDEEMIYTNSGFKLSPLPLFIVDKADEGFDYMKPTEYVNIYAKSIIFPNNKGIQSNSEEKIDFSHLNILHLEDAIDKMRKVIFFKKFDNKELIGKCVKTIKVWKGWTFEKFKKQITKAEKFKDDIMKGIEDCLTHMDIPKEHAGKEGKAHMYYDLINKFNVRELSKYH